MLARGVLRIVNDATKVQELQVDLLAGETRDHIEHFQGYGFTSHPFPGAEAVVAFHGGNREHGFVLKVDDRRYRLKSLAQGEVAIYDDQGNKVTLQRNHKILAETGDGNAKVELDGVLKKISIEAGAMSAELDGIAQSVILDAGGPNVTVDGATSTVIVENGSTAKVTVGPVNVFLEADPSTSILIAPGTITFNAAAYVFN
jgi:phage baseplate assembly protein V